MKQEIEYIEIDKLRLWSENPRDPINKEANDFEIISHALKDDYKKWNLDKLINKMGTYMTLVNFQQLLRTKMNILFMMEIEDLQSLRC